MFKYSLIFLIMSAIKLIPAQPTSPQYTVAVVEYNPIENPGIEPELLISRNAGNYERIMANLSEQMSYDLIVFPEATLTKNARITSRTELYDYAVEVPDPKDHTSPCYSSSDFPAYFSLFSCSALNINTYLVVNLYERKRCDNSSQAGCASDGWDYYNTNVVFDRNGTVVGRYRKTHLFGDTLFNVTKVPEISIIQTDFGVKFGMFTCFDILFATPAMDLVKVHGMRHFIFTSLWYSELPFLTALQTQQQWAQEFDSVLLASNGNAPSIGHGGSGIYQGKSGHVVADIYDTEDTKVYTARLPYDSQQETSDTDAAAMKMDHFFISRDDLRPYSSQVIDLSHAETAGVICSLDLCCEFSVKISIGQGFREPYYRYRMVAFSGVRTFSGFATGGVETCGIVACTGGNIEQCTERFSDYSKINWPITFEQVTLRANYSLQNRAQYPNSLLSSIRPLPAEATEWTQKKFGDKTERTFKLIKPQNRLMTFAIYGRDFNRDGDEVTRAAARKTNGSKRTVPLQIIFIMIFLSGLI